MPPAAAMASLKPPVAVSADSESLAAEVMMARSEAATPARLVVSIWMDVLDGMGREGRGRMKGAYGEFGVYFGEGVAGCSA